MSFSAAYTTARSVFHTKVFRLSQHIDRLCTLCSHFLLLDTSVSGLFPEEQKNLNITREEVQNTVLENVRKARDYLCKVNPSILTDKLDVKFSVIIEKPTSEIVFHSDSYLCTETSCFSVDSANDNVPSTSNYLRFVSCCS